MVSKDDRIVNQVEDPEVILDVQYVDRLEALVAASGPTRRFTDDVRRLIQEIDRAKIVPSTEFPAGVVNIGSRVSYQDLNTRQLTVVTLVLPEDANLDRGRISVLTPIGVALIGLSIGARFHWETRGGQQRWFEVVEVRESSGE